MSNIALVKDLVSKTNQAPAPSIQTPMSAVEVKNHVNLVQQVMASVMKENEHYGIIPGCKKPSLWKSGAETLLLTFRFAATYSEMSVVEKSDLISYRIKCTIIHQTTGSIIAEGLGACNSQEKKYAKSAPFDVQNTLYKMACKRALIAATLNAVAASDIFTQDIEDLPPEALKEEVTLPNSQHIQENIEVCNFGKNKGTRWDSMNIETLEWYISYFEQKLSNPDPKYSDRQQRTLNYIKTLI